MKAPVASPYPQAAPLRVELSKLSGKKLLRFTTALDKAFDEGAEELEISETAKWLTLRWHFSAHIREISLGPRGGIKASEREWWEKSVGDVWW